MTGSPHSVDNPQGKGLNMSIVVVCWAPALRALQFMHPLVTQKLLAHPLHASATVNLNPGRYI